LIVVENHNIHSATLCLDLPGLPASLLLCGYHLRFKD
jgi:hypothetical protein